MNLTVGRACPQRAESDVFQARGAARRDGLALPGSWRVRMLIRPRQLSTSQPTPSPLLGGEGVGSCAAGRTPWPWHLSRNLVLAWVLLAFHPLSAPGRQPVLRLKAGASALDITPDKFPVIVNGGFLEAQAGKANDPLHARALVLDDGTNRVAIAVIDSCMLPRDSIDVAKRQARDLTGIAEDRMLVSATHTHSAPSAMGCLGASPDPEYTRTLPGKIAQAIAAAAKNLAPARIGWAVVDDVEHTHNRRWIFRPDKIRTDPFGGKTVRANMHPGYENPDCLGPSGPVDPGLTVVAIQSPQGKPIVLLANYSMHYFGAAPVSADYYGRFAEKIKNLIGAQGVDPPFIGIMSQGTSGDQMWMDYGKPRRNLNLDEYADGVARSAFAAYQKIRFRDWAPVAMAESRLTLRRRTPNKERLDWARAIVAKMEGRKPTNQVEVYAREQIFLHEDPVRELKLQAIRIGALGIAAIPNEVFAITGLKIKALSPFPTTFTIELANGSEGYIPPPAQHALGGYTAWPARTAALEVEAEPKIADAVLQLLERLHRHEATSRTNAHDAGRAARPRRPTSAGATHDTYAKAVLSSKPIAYWRLGEFNGPTAFDSSGNGNHAIYEDGTAPNVERGSASGIAYYLEGPTAPGFRSAELHSAVSRIFNPPHVGFPEGLPTTSRRYSRFKICAASATLNRCVHLAGGRLRASSNGLGDRYTVELWFWNGLPANVRSVTGVLFSRGAEGAPTSSADKILIPRMNGPEGALVFESHEFAHQRGWKTQSHGTTPLTLKTWNHLVFVRDRQNVSVFLNGSLAPEISAVTRIPDAATAPELSIGGEWQARDSSFEGKIDEVAIYDRVLIRKEIQRHFRSGRINE